MVAQAAGVDGRRDELVAERVHGKQRRHLGDVAVVVGVGRLGEGRAGLGLDRDDLDLGAVDLVGDEGEGEAGEVGAAAGAADDHVAACLAGLRELLLGLEADDGLVEQDVVEHAAERVAGRARRDR